jgi:hypothetical protein
LALDGELHRHAFCRAGRRCRQSQSIGASNWENGSGSPKFCAAQMPAMYISGSSACQNLAALLDASVIFGIASVGHGVARSCRKANDSYRGRPRWGHAVNPPRGGFFIADVTGQRAAVGSDSPASLPASHTGNARSDKPSGETSHRGFRLTVVDSAGQCRRWVRS